MCCKTGQYLDNKNCICKNKLASRIVRECNSVINENNGDDIDNTITYDYLSCYLLESFVLVYSLISNGLKA